MNLLFLTWGSASMKKTVIVVCCIVFGLFLLPVVALASVTDLSALGTSSDNTLYTAPVMAGNKYDYGYCTYWAALRRIEIGKPIPNTWGDAHTWDDGARLDNYLVDHTPTFGAVMQTDAGALGHVAFVESVSVVDGSWTISEMNVAGWDILDHRTFPASAASKVNFIHEQLRLL